MTKIAKMALPQVRFFERLLEEHTAHDGREAERGSRKAAGDTSLGYFPPSDVGLGNMARELADEERKKKKLYFMGF